MAIDRTRRLVDRLVTWSPVLLLGGLAALTYWLDAQIQPQPPRIDGSSRHDPDIFIDGLRGVSFDAEGRPRQVLSAKRAQHYPDDGSVTLGGKGEGPATLTTDFLRVVPKKGLAETDRPVTIEEPRGIIHSTGLKLDNEAKTLKLISGVHGTIQPDTLPTK